MSQSKGETEELRHEVLERQREFWKTYEWLRVALQKTVIWGVFFFLLWLLRDFFALIFVTFVFSFVSTSAVKLMGRSFPNMSWKGRVTLAFAGILFLVTTFVWMTVPQIKQGIVQLNQTVRALPETWKNDIDPWLYEKSGFYRRLVANPDAGAEGVEIPEATDDTAAAVSETELPERLPFWEVEKVQEVVAEWQEKVLARFPDVVTDVVTGITAIGSLFFLSFVFSFLIVLDLDKLRREVAKLEKTKLENFYAETVRSIVEFGAVLGKVLEAQAVISLVNTVLTAIALWALGVPNVGFLSLFVFLCGFVPVAGVFISSTPICLIGLYDGGMGTLITLILVITGIHFLEAYVLNPRIMGAALHINPVLVLIILVIGHHSLGMWGLLLGLPICYYFFTHVIKRENPEIGLRATFKRRQGTPKAGAK